MQVTYAPDEPRLFWLREKPEDPQFEPHFGIKNGSGFWVLGSPVYIYIFASAQVQNTHNSKVLHHADEIVYAMHIFVFNVGFSKTAKSTSTAVCLSIWMHTFCPFFFCITTIFYRLINRYLYFCKWKIRQMHEPEGWVHWTSIKVEGNVHIIFCNNSRAQSTQLLIYFACDLFKLDVFFNAMKKIFSSI